jgi:hypothetical protein
MAYNEYMTEITLVLPFALPPPELAPDLVRALDAPVLAALLSRTSSQQANAAAADARALPHELWLARSLGLAAGRTLPFAAAAMRGYGLDPAAGNWFIVNPAHIVISRTFLMMTDLVHARRRLGRARHRLARCRHRHEPDRLAAAWRTRT